MTALWADIQNEIRRQMATLSPRIMLAGSASAGKRKLRDLTEATAGDELYARLKGTPKIATDDPVAVLILGGKKFILGPISNEDQTEITYDLPIVGEKGFNSPQRDRFSQDSADVSSSTDTANYVTNFDWDWALGSGTWTVWAFTDQACSHSSAGSLVRGRTVVDGSGSAVPLAFGMPADPTRGVIPTESLKTGCTGTITISAQYRPVTSGTGYGGGGRGAAFAFRTS